MIRSSAQPSLRETQYSFDTVMQVTSRPPIVFVEGRGSWLRDADGNDYLDFVQGWAVNCLGHCPDALSVAIAAQAGQLLNCSPSFYNAPMIRLANLVAQHSGLHQSFFINSGAEAIEGAIKLARKWGQLHRNGAYEIVTMDGAFHGRTLAAMSASGKPHWEPLFEPKVPGFRKVRFNDIDEVEQAITANTVAVMLEPIQGEAGVFVATDAFMRDVRALTRQKGILLILDEIQTGIGRTGKFFGYQHAGVMPDIMVLAKGLGGGLPLAALVAHEDVCCFVDGDQGSTFGGNAFATAVGCAVMEEIGKPGFLPHVAAAGDYLASRLQELSRQHHCGEVRGRGLLRALALGRDIGPSVAAQALQRGLLINAPHPDTLRLMPALTVTHQEIDQMIDRLGDVLKETIAT